MRIECPSCGVCGKADDAYRGKKIRCPKCDEVFLCEETDESVDSVVEQVETVEEGDPVDRAESVESGPSAQQAKREDVEEEAEDVAEDIFGSQPMEEPIPENDPVAEVCDYCDAEGKPGDQFEIVDMKKACPDCLPLVSGGGGKTFNGYQPVHGSNLGSGGRPGPERKREKSLAGNIVGSFKKLFSR